MKTEIMSPRLCLGRMYVLRYLFALIFFSIVLKEQTSHDGVITTELPLTVPTRLSGCTGSLRNTPMNGARSSVKALTQHSQSSTNTIHKRSMETVHWKKKAEDWPFDCSVADSCNRPHITVQYSQG